MFIITESNIYLKIKNRFDKDVKPKNFYFNFLLCFNRTHWYDEQYNGMMTQTLHTLNKLIHILNDTKGFGPRNRCTETISIQNFFSFTPNTRCFANFYSCGIISGCIELRKYCAIVFLDIILGFLKVSKSDLVHKF